MTIRHIITAIATLFTLLPALPANAAEKTAAGSVLTPEESLFPELVVMLHTDESGKECLKTPVARYKDEQGRIVDLVGAVHLADARYYRALNRSFARYDKVLYEMVDGEDLPEITRISRRIENGTATEEDYQRYYAYQNSRQTSVSSNVLGSFYIYMAGKMDLSLQAEVIDYGRTNLVYADMSSAEFSAAMEERGESWFTLVMDSLREGNTAGSDNMLFMTSPTELRRTVCRQLAATAAGSRSEHRAIIISRNERCMQVLDQVLANTEEPARRIAIFYGAMHLRDMHHRLLERGFTLIGVQWVSAIRVER